MQHSMGGDRRLEGSWAPRQFLVLRVAAYEVGGLPNTREAQADTSTTLGMVKWGGLQLKWPNLEVALRAL